MVKKNILIVYDAMQNDGSVCKGNMCVSYYGPWPPKFIDIRNLEEEITNKSGFKNTVLINIIELGDDDKEEEHE